MGTRSRIALQLDGDNLVSVYCHWDGYPTFNGKILRQYFNTRDKVSELIDGGDISSLWSDSTWDLKESRPNQTLYYSERGEDCPPKLHDNFYDLLKFAEEFTYVFDNNQWICYAHNGWDGEKHSVSTKVEIPSGNLYNSDGTAVSDELIAA